MSTDLLSRQVVVTKATLTTTTTATTACQLGGAVAQSVERAISGKEILGSIRAVAIRSPLVGSVSV